MDAPPEVAAANAAARAMLRDTSATTSSNSEAASYEAWIATVHPENVRLDDRCVCRSPNTVLCGGAAAVTANRQAGSSSLVALLVGAIIAFAVFAAALAFIAARARPSSAPARSRGCAARCARTRCATTTPTWSASPRACSPAWPPSSSSRWNAVADAGVAFGEEAALQLLARCGGKLFIALFALTQGGAAGRRLAEQRAAALAAAASSAPRRQRCASASHAAVRRAGVELADGMCYGMNAHAPTSFERMSTLRRELATPPSKNARMMRNWRKDRRHQVWAKDGRQLLLERLSAGCRRRGPSGGRAT